MTGIAVGAVLGALAFAVIIFVLWYRHCRNRQRSRQSSIVKTERLNLAGGGQGINQGPQLAIMERVVIV
jgi:predicted outer membrane lipoprotein